MFQYSQAGVLKVIKIEHFKNGTNERHQALQVEKNGITQCSYHLHLNRGKKSLCINLKHPKGIELIHGLIKKSDIVIENFAVNSNDPIYLVNFAENWIESPVIG